MSVPPKKMKGREECVEMLKKAFAILMSAEATASADDEC